MYLYIYKYSYIYIYIYINFASQQPCLCNDQEPSLVGPTLTDQQKNCPCWTCCPPQSICHDNIPLNIQPFFATMLIKKHQVIH